MLLVLGLAALIWGAGAAFGQPRERRIVVLGMLFGLVIGLNLLLPQAQILLPNLAQPVQKMLWMNLEIKLN